MSGTSVLDMSRCCITRRKVPRSVLYVLSECQRRKTAASAASTSCPFRQSWQKALSRRAGLGLSFVQPNLPCLVTSDILG